MSAFEKILTPPRAFLILFFLCCATYTPGISTIPPIDRDEARYMQASKQMLETGDWIDIRFQDAARHKKPIGIYWLHVASVSIFGDSITDVTWYRAVSVTGAIVAVLMTFKFGAQWIGVPAAFIGAITLAATIGLTFESHMAKTDAMLLATIVAMQGALGRIYLSRFTSVQRGSDGITETSHGRFTVAMF